MRPAATVLQLAVCLSSLAPLTAAWSGRHPGPGGLVVRADETTTGMSTLCFRTVYSKADLGQKSQQKQPHPLERMPRRLLLQPEGGSGQQTSTRRNFKLELRPRVRQRQEKTSRTRQTRRATMKIATGTSVRLSHLMTLPVVSA